MKCDMCKFWMKYSNRKHLGECRKYAPERETLWSLGGWPKTKDIDFCWEFELKPNYEITEKEGE